MYAPDQDKFPFFTDEMPIVKNLPAAHNRVRAGQAPDR
jgi:hypothetical protein